MKLIEKLKNVFFEEVEVDEEELPQTFAKKVEIPKKEVEKVEKKKYNFDFDDEKEEKLEKKEVEEKPKEDEKIIIEEEKQEKEFPMMFDDDDFLEDSMYEQLKPEKRNVYEKETFAKRDDMEKDLYRSKQETKYTESINSKPSFSQTNIYREEKSKKVFKPSPIISPIYGIMDQSYKKEETIITKRETKIVSTKSKPDIDSIRSKVFGGDEEEKNDIQKTTTKVYDVNNNKPQVSKVTLADADEYYNDLGLAYNVDYSDASRSTSSRTTKYSQKEKKKNKNNTDDNLFDLIDSMYNRED